METATMETSAMETSAETTATMEASPASAVTSRPRGRTQRKQSETNHTE
jgi:hypothetical protein